MNDTNQFRVINEQGKEIICDILFTFDNADNGKSYIVYTDNSRDQYGNIEVYASIYDPTQKTPKLEPIETKEEWIIIETILNSLQENIKNGKNLNIDEIVQAVMNEVSSKAKDEFDEEEYFDEDDFGDLDPTIDKDLGFIQPIVLKLHIYEKHSFNHSSHVPHTKLGEVLIDGTCGTITIGNSRICDICIPNTFDLRPLHMMLMIVNGKVFISDLVYSLTKCTINDQEIIGESDGNAFFYEIKNGDYFTIAHKYKVYIEIVNPANSNILECQLCGKKFIQTLNDVEYCVDCRKKLEEEMGMDIKNELIKVNLNDYLEPLQKEDLDIKIINVLEKYPKIFGKMFKR